MKDRWFLLSDTHAAGEGRWEANAFAPHDSPWFDGHFPGQPILPGIALVETVLQAIRQTCPDEYKPLGIGRLRRVRFTRPVLPGESLTVNLESSIVKGDLWFTFKISVDDHVVCTGQLAPGIRKNKNQYDE